MNSGPYSQTLESDGCIHRIFSAGVDDIELKWHRDDCDRVVTFITGNGWSFQLEGEMPQQTGPGLIIVIPKLRWHRLIHDGGPDLHVRIREM